MPFQSFFQIPRRPVELPIYRHLQIPTVNGRAIPLTSRPTVPLPGNFDVSVEKRSNELSGGKKKKKKESEEMAIASSCFVFRDLDHELRLILSSRGNERAFYRVRGQKVASVS